MSLLHLSPNIQAAVTGSGIFVGFDTIIIDFPKVFAAGDSWGYDIDGTTISVPFNTSNEQTLADIVTALVATGFFTKVSIVTADKNPSHAGRIQALGAFDGHQFAFTLPTGTVQPTGLLQTGVRELGLVIANPMDLLLSVRIVTAGAIQYVGNAITGSSTASPVWSVKKIDQTVGTVVTWADGNSNNDNIFDNYLTLSYS